MESPEGTESYSSGREPRDGGTQTVPPPPAPPQGPAVPGLGEGREGLCSRDRYSGLTPRAIRFRPHSGAKTAFHTSGGPKSLEPFRAVSQSPFSGPVFNPSVRRSRAHNRCMGGAPAVLSSYQPDVSVLKLRFFQQTGLPSFCGFCEDGSVQKTRCPHQDRGAHR